MRRNNEIRLFNIVDTSLAQMAPRQMRFAKGTKIITLAIGPDEYATIIIHSEAIDKLYKRNEEDV